MHNPAHPGKVLGELVLKDRNISIGEFAKKIKITKIKLNNVIVGRSSITPDIAVRLSVVLGTSIDLWLNMQNAYDKYQAQKKLDQKKIKLEPLQVL